ncbi:hypothetical protein JHK82_054706 [Glycine max]|nr:hypothetical protein JHK86_054556 [Glycine max]KAG5084537.1 hypothetical protein JHK84_054575 [Glycine max]KAG5087309.1 hypothetical protein JHK82_054706 [Glycine max]
MIVPNFKPKPTSQILDFDMADPFRWDPFSHSIASRCPSSSPPYSPASWSPPPSKSERCGGSGGATRSRSSGCYVSLLGRIPLISSSSYDVVSSFSFNSSTTRFPPSCLSYGSSSRNLSKFSQSSSPRSHSPLCTAIAFGHQRRPLMDLVTMLDVGNSMSSAKLHMLKCAMWLVISSLGAANELAVVASVANSKWLLLLRRMTN